MPDVEKICGIQCIANSHHTHGSCPDFLSRAATEPVRHLHQSIPAYSPTPLTVLPSLAQRLGIGTICVKDESKRFGLNAFKGLGGTYALCRVVCEKLGLDYRTVTLEQLQTPENREKISQMVFITTTDGNHGRGISWAAGLLGAQAYIYMPRGSVEARAQAIRDAGNAVVTITDLSYDDAVRYTAKLAEENGWYLVQDTSWPGYEEVPRWIIQGYTTMVYEALDQMEAQGLRPTHVFLQAGVGAMAGGVLGALCCTFQEKRPVVAIVEPDQVACIFESVRRGDGAEHKATGSEITIMAGLNCAEPCQLTWPILRDFSDFCFACPDWVAARGMRVLAAPSGGDAVIVSGESGAVTTGLLSLLGKQKFSAFRQALGLDEHSVVLLISTEGDTDPDGYQRIVYDGAYPAEYQ